MALKVVGVGLGRTGTNSLKLALEELLGGPCYHMFELIAHPQQVALWELAVRGEEVDWNALFEGYAATVDWPGCAFWRDLITANPNAPVLLSTRDSPQTWWASMEQTIIPALQGPMLSDHPDLMRGQKMVRDLFRTRFTPDFANRDAGSRSTSAIVMTYATRSRRKGSSSGSHVTGGSPYARVSASPCLRHRFRTRTAARTSAGK